MGFGCFIDVCATGADGRSLRLSVVFWFWSCSVESGWLIGDEADGGVVQVWRRILLKFRQRKSWKELRSDRVLAVVISYFPCLIPYLIIDSSFPM